ncbi:MULTISPECIES: hypothetical protein [unclassified Rhodococcus (in: high G+C Gram-positive bacteria)]|uniref:hypothetical protein n=1 Tax=unclassified Rhodococcus (in: high G+C Gram-positive bacteria) TaxID=192944 RepID=UPI0016399913|nr:MULTISPECIES: hypothetical protein [unclassified Rhodococcus (in: high G+C Gram-positive bacteria)]MBC2644576.1 hypothetical protein [Rhodococcus sp. 3A]MBC2897735.1 hypothetical protein [Rhodococcus sp. 4CII]
MYATTPGTGADPAQPPPRLSARDRHVWVLFADWCAATDQPPIPATPQQLARFLRDNPAAPATQRRRVSVINTVHRRQGHPAPGTDEAIRRALNTTRAARLHRVSAIVAERLPQIPIAGWPAGFFGRRDRLILVLAAAGVGFEQIARLRRRDLTAPGDHNASLLLTVDGGRVDLPESPEIPVGVIYREWIEVLGFLDRNEGTGPVAKRFEAGRDLTGFDAGYRADDRPLLTSINRWGHTPLDPAPPTARAVAAIVRAHLSGTAPAHVLPPPKPRPRPAESPGRYPIDDGRVLDPSYYERGTAARRNAHHELTDVTDLLDDIEDRADQLLAELDGILDNTF